MLERVSRNGRGGCSAGRRSSCRREAAHGRARRGGLPPRGRGEPHLHLRQRAWPASPWPTPPSTSSGPRGGERAPRAAAVAGGAGGRVFQRAHEPHRAGAGHRRARAAALPRRTGKVRFQAVAQDRFFVTATRGRPQITAAAVLAGRAEVDRRVPITAGRPTRWKTACRRVRQPASPTPVRRMSVPPETLRPSGRGFPGRRPLPASSA